MSENAPVSNGPGVALLFEDADLSAHLRQALVEAGARIVHEGPATQATRDDLSGNGADVVVVNLDARVEEHLDALYEIFDESRQKVVFNDAEASSGLSGWDQARWARHLAAKLLDGHDVDPPRPAEARAIEAQPTELTLPEDEMPEAPPDEAPPVADADGDAGQDTDLTAELEALLAEDGDLLGGGDHDEQAARDAASEPQATELSEDEREAIAALSGVDEAPAPDGDAGMTGEPASEDASVAGEPATGEDAVEPVAPAEAMGESARTGEPDASADADDADDGFEQTLRMFDQALAENSGEDGEDPHAQAEALFAADDSAAGDDTPDAEPTQAPEDEDAPVPESGGQAASTLELADRDSPAATPEPAKPASTLSADAGSAYSLVDPEDDSPADPAAGQEKQVTAPDAPDWGLVDFDDADVDEPVTSPSGMHIMQQNAKVAQVDPSVFGIEKMSASEYLSPEDQGEDGDTPIEPGMSLELEPLEQAVAPKMVEEGEAGEPAEPFGANLEGGIRRVVVVAVGSSEESRSSLRDFLAAIDRVPDAAILAVVHQQAGDNLASLAAEWNSASPILPVRVAEAQGKAHHGEVVLVPVGKQAALQANGQLQLLDTAAQPMANPSIDLTMTLVAQEFGENVLAIVLAGDAIDALAGALAVSDGGGKVWALDPADCNDNTMVSVLCEEQLAEQTGSPQELAARMLKELS